MVRMQQERGMPARLCMHNKQPFLDGNHQQNNTPSFLGGIANCLFLIRGQQRLRSKQDYDIHDIPAPTWYGLGSGEEMGCRKGIGLWS